MSDIGWWAETNELAENIVPRDEQLTDEQLDQVIYLLSPLTQVA